jgi:hypothetical protein
MQRQVFVGNKTFCFESNLSQVERENGYFYRKKTFSLFFSLKYLLIEGKIGGNNGAMNFCSTTFSIMTLGILKNARTTHGIITQTDCYTRKY